MNTAPQITLKSLFAAEDIKAKFDSMLGDKKATGFIVSVLDTVNSNYLLKKADPQSVLFAAATAASLDLPINSNLGFAYIVPYKGAAQFQMGYKGFVQLAMRSGQFQKIETTTVYDGDTEQTIYERLTKFITPEPPSDIVVGYIAYFRLTNGFEKSLYMSKAEVDKHAKSYSQSYKSGSSSLWQTDFNKMALKTVLKQLLSKYAPLNIEMQKAIAADQAVVRDIDGNSFLYPDNSPDIDIDDLKALYAEKSENISEDEKIQIERILNNEESQSYSKLLKRLNEI